MNIKDIKLSELNQSKKGQILHDSTCGMYLNSKIAVDNISVIVRVSCRGKWGIAVQQV